MTEKETLLIEEAKKYVLRLLKNESTGHDYQHSLRVYQTALAISKNYQVNQFIIAISALLHDLDDYKISENTTRALSFLNDFLIDEKHQIMEIIDNMSFSAYKKGKTVKTLEGKIVQDADRLDALGASGIARCFAYSGHKNRAIYQEDLDDESAIAHFYQKLFKLPDLLNTLEAKIIAEKRIKFMETYLEEFFLEWKADN